MSVEVRYHQAGEGDERPLFANVEGSCGPCLETTFEGWRFGEETRYFFQNDTQGVITIGIWSLNNARATWSIFGQVTLLPGECYEEEAWNRSFQIITPDRQVHEARGKISSSDQNCRFFFYALADNAVKEIQGVMVSGRAWSRWRPTSLMTDTENFLNLKQDMEEVVAQALPEKVATALVATARPDSKQDRALRIAAPSPDNAGKQQKPKGISRTRAGGFRARTSPRSRVSPRACFSPRARTSRPRGTLLTAAWK